MDRESRFDVLILFIAACVVRLLCIPLFLTLGLTEDERYYWDFAIQLAHSGRLPQIFFHPPVWGCLLAIPAFFSENPLYGRLFTVFISSLAVIPISVLGKRLFGRRAGILAGALYVVYPNSIGFSHYLWSESLCALLVPIFSLLFLDAVQNKTELRTFYLPCIVMGAGLLVKEFAIIVFASYITVFIARGMHRKRARIALATALFLTPAVIYSAYASLQQGSVVPLANSAGANIVKAHQTRAIREPREDGRYATRSFAGQGAGERISSIARSTVHNFSNLWSANSYPLNRVLYGKKRHGRYRVGRRHKKHVAAPIVGFYIFLMITGLSGLCLSDTTPFRTFAACNLIYLSLLSVLFYLSSRFRLPFMSFFMVYAAAVISNPGRIIAGLKDRRRAIAWLVLMVLFAYVVISRWWAIGFHISDLYRHDFNRPSCVSPTGGVY